MRIVEQRTLQLLTITVEKLNERFSIKKKKTKKIQRIYETFMENYEIKKIQCLRNSYFYKLLFIFES